jgi:hypothetical protein
MHNKRTRFAALIGAVAVAVLALAAVATLSVSAQGNAEPSPLPIQPPTCYLAAHDLNGDGKVNEFDMNRWKDLLFKSGGECKLRAPASACPKGMDINKDGVITFDDLNIMLARYRTCMMPRSYVTP